jgi:hypothetical protein
MRNNTRALGLAIAGTVVLGCMSAGVSFAECVVKEPLRPVQRTYIRRDVVEPGVYEVQRQPSVYGWTSERVETPGETILHEEPAVYRTVPVRIRQGGGWAWEKRTVRGKEAMCRVRIPATYTTVERHILVRPARRWAERTPSSVGYVHRRILLRPYKNIAHFQRPYVAWSREHLTIQPEGFRWRPTAEKPDC